MQSQDNAIDIGELFLESNEETLELKPLPIVWMHTADVLFLYVTKCRGCGAEYETPGEHVKSRYVHLNHEDRVVTTKDKLPHIDADRIRRFIKRVHRRADCCQKCFGHQ